MVSFLVLFFFVLGAVCCFVFTSVRFMGILFFGAAAFTLCCVGLRLYAKHNPKVAMILGIIMAVVIFLALCAAFFTGTQIYRAMQPREEAPCEYIIVLGAGVNGTEPSLSLWERIQAAYAYLNTHPQSICIVSGSQGPGESITEAACMLRELTELGIDPARIWTEDKATTTRENLAFSLDLIEARTGTRPRRVGLVSSDYHMYRASLFAREQQVTAVSIPAHTSWLSLRINYFLREIVAVWYYTTLGGL